MTTDMKKTISILSAVLIAACFSMTAAAHKYCKEDWKEKIRNEKIAFLTAEIGLTPEEAQVFWPVYNQVSLEKDVAMKEVINSYRELRKATEEGKSGKEISDLLDKHTAAQTKLRDIDNGMAERYKSVLPVEKVAKLYVGEEKFRRNHIRSMKGGPQRDGKPGPKE